VNPYINRHQDEAFDKSMTTFIFTSPTPLSTSEGCYLPSLAELGSRTVAAQDTLRAKEAQDNLKFCFKPYNKLITDRLKMKWEESR